MNQLHNEQEPNTFQEDIQKALVIELEILNKIKTRFPRAFKMDGNVKEFDLVIPEVKEMWIEIKNDAMSDSTGNFAFEYESYGKPSGIATTKADVWIMVTKDYYYFFPVVSIRAFLLNNQDMMPRGKGGNQLASMCFYPSREWTRNSTACYVFGRNTEIGTLNMLAWLERFIG